MIGLVTGVCLGGVGGASTFCTFVLGSSLVASVVLSAAVAEDWEAATRCNALPSLRNLVIKFSRCNFAEGRVMATSNDSISSASESRSVARSSAAVLFVGGD